MGVGTGHVGTLPGEAPVPFILCLRARLSGTSVKEADLRQGKGELLGPGPASRERPGQSSHLGFRQTSPGMQPGYQPYLLSPPICFLTRCQLWAWKSEEPCCRPVLLKPGATLTNPQLRTFRPLWAVSSQRLRSVSWSLGSTDFSPWTKSISLTC